MSVRDRMFGLKTAEEVNEFLEGKLVAALFKAGGCHKTGQGFGFVEKALDKRANIPLGFVKVIEDRPASNHITEITGIIHQSPQFILFIDGKPVFDVDNWDITLDVVESALEQHLGVAGESSATDKAHVDNVDSYIALLECFLSEEMGVDQFSSQWLATFQMDGTMHSTEQFTLLNSLFGDVDAALANKPLTEGVGHICSGRAVEEETLKQRATELLNTLKV